MRAEIEGVINENIETLTAQVSNAGAAVKAGNMAKLSKAIGIIEKVARVIGTLIRAIENER